MATIMNPPPLLLKAMLLVALVGFVGLGSWKASGSEPTNATITITPSSVDAREAFDELARQGGPKVRVLGDWWTLYDHPQSGVRRMLLVPMELRFKPVEGRKFVEALAAVHELKVAWVREGKYAVLFEEASDLSGVLNRTVRSFQIELFGLAARRLILSFPSSTSTISLENDHCPADFIASTYGSRTSSLSTISSSE
jgi:hypothetical protein